jgi:hypothetical protein
MIFEALLSSSGGAALGGPVSAARTPAARSCDEPVGDGTYGAVLCWHHVGRDRKNIPSLRNLWKVRAQVLTSEISSRKVSLPHGVELK